MNKINFAKEMRKIANKARFFSKHLSRPVSKVLFVTAPFVSVYSSRNGLKAAMVTAGILITMAIATEIIARVSRSYDDIPVPAKRFTRETPSSVTVDEQDAEEMILYLNDIENYLERKGLI